MPTRRATAVLVLVLAALAAFIVTLPAGTADADNGYPLPIYGDPRGRQTVVFRATNATQYRLDLHIGDKCG